MKTNSVGLDMHPARGTGQVFIDLMVAMAHKDNGTQQVVKKMALPVCCLVEADESALWSDAAAWPNLLVGGTTGSGKTVTLTSWLASLMMGVSPSQLRVTLADPVCVGTTFPWAKSAPHVDALLTTPVEVQPLVAQWANEADARLAAFETGGVENVKAAIAAGWTQYPYRILVIDEYKGLKEQMEPDDLKAMEHDIERLSQQALETGLLLWITTQHTMVETIHSTFKANLPARLALKMASAAASQIILDDTGAETLLGKGDALFRSTPGESPVRGQIPLATEGVWQAIRDKWTKGVGTDVSTK